MVTFRYSLIISIKCWIYTKVLTIDLFFSYENLLFTQVWLCCSCWCDRPCFLKSSSSVTLTPTRVSPLLSSWTSEAGFLQREASCTAPCADVPLTVNSRETAGKYKDSEKLKRLVRIIGTRSTGDFLDGIEKSRHPPFLPF